VSGPATILAGVRASAAAGRGALVFHLSDGVVRMTTRDLVAAAEARAAKLSAWGIRPGDRIGVLGMNDPQWAAWAYGIWEAGALLVPMPYSLRVGDREGLAERLGVLADTAGCRLVMTDPRFAPFLPGLATPWDGAPTRLLPEPGPSSVDLDGAAIVQFTSGSTANPKPLVITHRAVVSLLDSVLVLFGRPEEDRHLSWLPFFHDWGLIHFLVMSQMAGVESHVLPTERFARSPQEWFRLVAETRATFTGGPPSAWAVALRLAGDRGPEVDLSSLRYCLLGAEMIEPEVVDRLAEDGGRLGLAREALACGWGLAEATFCLTCPAPGVGPRIDGIAAGPFAAEGVARPTEPGEPERRVVGAGAPLPGVEIRVIGPEGTPVADRRVGEIEALAPYLMRGYLSAEAEDPFTADGWLRTGDLGYLAEGDLFVTGRTKDVIIVFGRNYAPEEIEWAAGRVPGVRAGRCVAFAAADGREGTFVVAVEVRDVDDAPGLQDRVREAVFDAIGAAPQDVLTVPRGWIPRTTSGKLRRSAVREAYQANAVPSSPQVSTGPPDRQ
jgi:acyl-CoA synthetase (AMP-forming)/AMP-acid ligase II